MPVPIKLDTKELDDIYALFDAVKAFMGDTYVSTNVYVTKDTTGTTSGITATDKNGNTFTFTERTVADRVAINPLGANLGPGETQQFTASVTASDGTVTQNAAVNWTLVYPARGTISASGLYMAPATVEGSLIDQVTATAESGAAATVSVQLHG